MIQSVEAMIHQYCAAWNENNAEAFKREFVKCWSDEAVYTDPNYDNVKGVDGIVALAVGSEALFPGRQFSVFIQPEHHHNVGRYTWQVNINGQTREGFDYFEFDESFKITRLVSFFKPIN